MLLRPLSAAGPTTTAAAAAALLLLLLLLMVLLPLNRDPGLLFARQLARGRSAGA